MLTAIVVSYNARHHLESCLEKLTTELEGGALGEILVADNASTDGSPEMVRERFPAVRLLELSENLGFGAANNRAADVAKGERLLLINSDAWLAPGALARLDAALDANPRRAMVAPDLRYPDGRRQFAWGPELGVLGESIQKVRNPFESHAWNHRLLPRLVGPFLGPGWLSAACLVVDKGAFLEVGGFDERFFLYFEDVDLSRRLLRAGWRLHIEPKARAYHVKGGSEEGEGSRIAYRHAQLLYYTLHRPAWENRLLQRRLRRKFKGVADADLRRRLLALLDQPGGPLLRNADGADDESPPSGARPHPKA